MNEKQNHRHSYNDISARFYFPWLTYICLYICLFIFMVNIWLSYYTLNERTFKLDRINGYFLKDGKPFRYISGSIHYFRIPPIYWKDRLMKAKLAGLDAIQIYIAWNFHQPSQHEFVFNDDHDVEKFITMAHELQLLVLVRAGPYICGEWDFGGLPGWLLSNNSNIKLRSSDQEFMKPVLVWFNELFLRLRPLLYKNGGPIIMIQIENEYGSYPLCDNDYLTQMYNFARSILGEEIILYTTDGSSASDLKCGSSDRRLFSTIDFGVSGAHYPKYSFQHLENFQPNLPLVNSEFYTGWLDHWSDIRHLVPAEDIVSGLTQLWNYSFRVSLNMYMFHGGTNFGYWNGANTPTEIIISSYDYDAPISESGDITRKYIMIRNLLFRLKHQPPPPLPSNITKVSYGTVVLERKCHFIYKLSGGLREKNPQTMEYMGQFQGFMAYQISLFIPEGKYDLSFQNVKDVGYIFMTDHNSVKILYHGFVRGRQKVVISVKHRYPVITIVTESQGHINFGLEMQGDVKGIIGNVFLDQTQLFNWTMKPLNLATENLTPLSIVDDAKNFPDVGIIYMGILTVPFEDESVHDTFAVMNGFERGILGINGKIVGRFFSSAGPQISLYVPANFLKLGDNIIRITELQGINSSICCSITFQDSMLWKN